MSQLMEPPTKRMKRGRALTVVLLIVTLIGTAATREFATDSYMDEVSRVHQLPVASAARATPSLQAMPSFALALLLGGLRGPLVMILWTSSESQKQEHDLQDFDTKVEWIRLLQPEFDTVHLFQIWNKAFNISVQMASLANKYATILDAIEYGQRVDAEKPDDVNIISAIAWVYGQKLGEAQEHVYYRGRVRRETQTLMRVTIPASEADAFRAAATPLGWIEDESPLVPDGNQLVVLLEKPLCMDLTGLVNGMVAKPEQPSTALGVSERREHMDSLLDEAGNVSKALTTPRYQRPANYPADADWYDGSPLQFLPKFEPYPYGLSPLAMAYNYNKRAEELLVVWNQHHYQSSDRVLSKEAAVSLKQWGSDEQERGRRFESRIWGQQISPSAELMDLEAVGVLVPMTQKVTDRPDLAAALYSYQTAWRVLDESNLEFENHLKRYPADGILQIEDTYDNLATSILMHADYDYLQALSSAGMQKQKYIADATREYMTSMQHYALILLKFYIEDSVAAKVFPIDPKTGLQFRRANIENADPSTYMDVLNEAITESKRREASGIPDRFGDDRREYVVHIARATARLSAMGAFLPTTRK